VGYERAIAGHVGKQHPVFSAANTGRGHPASLPQFRRVAACGRSPKHSCRRVRVPRFRRYIIPNRTQIGMSAIDGHLPACGLAGRSVGHPTGKAGGGSGRGREGGPFGCGSTLPRTAGRYFPNIISPILFYSNSPNKPQRTPSQKATYFRQLPDHKVPGIHFYRLSLAPVTPHPALQWATARLGAW